MKYLLKLFLTGAAAAAVCMGASAQSVKGTVRSAEGEALIGASVFWAGTTIGVSTDVQGNYSIHGVRDYNLLVAQYLGYVSDTVAVSAGMDRVDFLLRSEGIDVEGVEVSATQRGNYISSQAIGKFETISFAGLCKMACCNLAESFENSAAVTVGYSDAISGARQIRMLGLAGVYTQILDENRPIMKGLGAPYGLSYTPGMWLQSIQVSKGTASVVNGHEAITGQINLEYRKPTDDERLFVNAYIDDELRTELNITSALPVSKRFSTVIMAHGSRDNRNVDMNMDGFRDLPRTGQVNFANKWLYSAPSGVQVRFGVKGVLENRLGGMMSYKSSMHNDMKKNYPFAPYGSEIDNRNLNAYLKVGIPVGRSIYHAEEDEEHRSSVALVADWNYYDQGSYFGLKEYDGVQNSTFVNLMYNCYVSHSSSFNFGATVSHDYIRERLHDEFMVPGPDDADVFDSKNYNLRRKETEAGVYAEYTLNLHEKFSLVAGARGDYSSLYREFYFTPRGHVKWNIAGGLTLRASAGTGFRTTNPITDNIGILATGRRIIFGNGGANSYDDLYRQERAATFGGSLTETFRLGRDDNATVSVDFFRSTFRDQLVVDQEYDASTIRIYNLHGVSFTNTYQFDFSWAPFTGFDLFATFRYNDTKITLDRPNEMQAEVERPLVDRFKTLINLQYATKFRKWVFDVTAQLNGQSRLPVQNGDISVEKYSPVYPMFFAQVSRKFRRVDLYVGCENIGNYRQKNPILGAEHPFSTEFNSSVVWGPLMGRKIYAGVRFTLD